MSCFIFLSSKVSLILLFYRENTRQQVLWCRGSSGYENIYIENFLDMNNRQTVQLQLQLQLD